MFLYDASRLAGAGRGGEGWCRLGSNWDNCNRITFFKKEREKRQKKKEREREREIIPGLKIE